MTFHQPGAEFSAWAGQASWADPATNNTCSECIFWSRPGERVARTRYEYFGKHELAPRPCLKARQLNHEISAPVPHDCAGVRTLPSQSHRRRRCGRSTRGGIAKQTVSEFPTLCRRAPRLRYSPHVEGSYYYDRDYFKTSGSA